MSDPFNKLVMDFEDEIAKKANEIDWLATRIEELTKERDESRAMLVQTQVELLALKGELEKDHRSFNEAAKFSTECINSLTKRVEELEKDKRRLDWLESGGVVGWSIGTDPRPYAHTRKTDLSEADTIRLAIDAEMERE